MDDLPTSFPLERKNEIATIVGKTSHTLPPIQKSDYVALQNGTFFLPPHKSLLCALGHEEPVTDTVHADRDTYWYAAILKAEKAWFAQYKQNCKQQARDYIYEEETKTRNLLEITENLDREQLDSTGHTEHTLALFTSLKREFAQSEHDSRTKIESDELQTYLKYEKTELLEQKKQEKREESIRALRVINSIIDASIIKNFNQEPKSRTKITEEEAKLRQSLGLEYAKNYSSVRQKLQALAKQEQVKQKQKKQNEQAKVKTDKEKKAKKEERALLNQLLKNTIKPETDLELFQKYLSQIDSSNQIENQTEDQNEEKKAELTKATDQLIKLLEKNPTFALIEREGTHSITNEKYQGPTTILQILADSIYPVSLTHACLKALEVCSQNEKGKKNKLEAIINKESSEGLTALAYAAAHNDIEKVKALLQEDAIPNISCLAHAILHDAHDSLKEMLQVVKKYLTPETYQQLFSSLFCDQKISDHFSPAIFDTLVKLFPQQEAILSVCIFPALIETILNKEQLGIIAINEMAILENFLKRYPKEIQQPIKLADKKTTLFDLAITANASNPILELLLKHKMSPIQKNNFEPNNSDQETNALHLTGALLKADQLDYLLSQKPEWITTLGKDNRTLLHTVLRKRAASNITRTWTEESVLKTIEVILKQPKDLVMKILDAKTNSGDTALHVAAFVGNSGPLKRLLEAGADATLTNNCGVTPFVMALASLKKLREGTAMPAFQMQDAVTRRLVQCQLIAYCVIIEHFVNHISRLQQELNIVSPEAITNFLEKFGMPELIITDILDQIKNGSKFDPALRAAIKI